MSGQVWLFIDPVKTMASEVQSYSSFISLTDIAFFISSQQRGSSPFTGYSYHYLGKASDGYWGKQKLCPLSVLVVQRQMHFLFMPGVQRKQGLWEPI